MDTLTGQFINGYELRERVGSGGFGIVYRAYQPVIGRDVAVKVILPEHASRPQFIRRFELEPPLIARLEHPHIVPLYDYWQDADGAFLVMRWLPHTLREISQKGPWSIEATARFLDQIAEALHVAHRKNVIHRDVKPENLLLDGDGNAYLSDFGIAKEIDTASTAGKQAAVGSLRYTTPEQISGEHVTPQTDLYSLGLVLYEMLTGTNPFEEDSSSSLLFKQLNEPLPSLRTCRPDLPPAVDTVIQTATAKKAAHRYADALRMAAAFRATISPARWTSQPLVEPLTDREMDILSGIVSGLENTQIAEKLVLSLGTVRWYVKQIYSKLDAHTREQAITRATDLGLVSGKRKSGSFPNAPASQEQTPSAQDVTSMVQPPVVRARHNLPAQTTLFVGRETEQADLTTLLQTPTTRLVTVLGPGGMGKTRLALEVAAAQLSTFTHGVWFVPLVALSSPEQIVSAIADTLKFSFYGSAAPKQQILGYLSNKCMLLLLDSFEHLLDGAAFLTDILEAAPEVKLLVTSRERLVLRSETILSLGRMDFPRDVSPETALKYSAVQLFVECAHRVNRAIRYDRDALGSAARICQLVEGMPLGILLAAAWTEVLSLREIADEIERSLDFLEAELHDLPARQHSIRAVFDATWNRLSDAERSIFMKLSAFRGGFTRAAAQAVAGATLRALAGLVNKSLLWMDETGRYTIHELLRQYGASKLEWTGELESMRGSHSAYYLDALYERRIDLEGANQLATVNDIEVDFENVRAAWFEAVEHDQFDALERACHSIWLFAYIRGRYVEAVVFFAQTAQVLRRKPPTWERDLLLGDVLVKEAFLAKFPTRLYDNDRLQQLMAESWDLVEKSGSSAQQALWFVTDTLRGPWEGLEGVEPGLTRAVESYRSGGDYWGEAFALRYLAGAYSGINGAPVEYSLARQYLEDAYAISREIGDVYQQAQILHNLGLILFRMGLRPDAIQVTKEALVLRRRIGNQSMVANSLINISLFHATAGELEDGKKCAEEAVTIKRDHGVPSDANGFDGLGEVNIRLGFYDEARAAVLEGLARVKGTDQYDWIDIFCTYLIVLDFIEGHYGDAANSVVNWLESNAEADRPGKQHDMEFVLAMGALIALAQEDLPRAEMYGEQISQRSLTNKDRQARATHQIVAGHIAWMRESIDSQAEEIVDALRMALHYFENEYNPDLSLGWQPEFLMALARLTLSRSDCAKGHFESSRRYVDELLSRARRLSSKGLALRALTAHAELSAAQSRHEEAAVLASFVATSPFAFAVDRTAATQLLKTVEGTRDPRTSAAAHGTALDLWQMTDEILATRGNADE